jgi:hypothetical protein
MHRLPSKRSIYRLRMAALLMTGKCLITPVAAGMFLHSYVVSDLALSRVAIGLLVITGVLVLLQWIVAARANCPLCFGPVLGCKACAKNHKAQRLLGSHRLRVAADILLNNSFRCPYCGESTLLELRRKRRHSHPHGVDRMQ